MLLTYWQRMAIVVVCLGLAFGPAPAIRADDGALEARIRALVDGIDVQERLDPTLWPDGPGSKLDPLVRRSLLGLARVFIADMAVKDVVVKDIVFAGSLTGYLYHPRSDIDVHVHVDARKLSLDPKLVFTFLADHSKAWGEGRKLRMRGRAVQLFMLDIVNNKEGSSGVYSLIADRWTRLPRRPVKPIDKARVGALALKLVRRHLDAVATYRKDPQTTDCNVFFAFTKDLKKERARAFDTEGEYSLPNLVYKTLRNGRYTREAEAMNARCVEAKFNLP